MNRELYDYYLELLGPIPSFLEEYLQVPSMQRLKGIGYFCGMDYASKDVYNFKEYITRYDHSLTSALLAWRFTYDINITLSALFHDISTPCFSHVIDYMNKDYVNQESTEEYTKEIIMNDKELMFILNKNSIIIDSVCNSKKYSIVDNERPKLCIDRFDGIILNGISWSKNLSKEDIYDLVTSLYVFNNDDDKRELGFTNYDAYLTAVRTNDLINNLCHSKEDNFMMELLANITRLSIKEGIIDYKDLYNSTEDEVLSLINDYSYGSLSESLKTFKTIQKMDIPNFEIEKIKVRTINPIMNNRRINVK